MEGMPSGFGRHLRLPDSMREELRVPLGKLLDHMGFIEEVKGLNGLVTVGDYCSLQAVRGSVRPKVAVVDFKVKRRRDEGIRGSALYENAEILEAENPPAHITPAVWSALKKAFEEPGRFLIHVLGEEDLVALPAIALAPADFTIAYGLPSKGVVLVEPSEESKSRVEDILSRMEVLDEG